MIRLIFGGAEKKLFAVRRLLFFCQHRKLTIPSKILSNYIQKKYGVFLSPFNPIPLSTHFPHPTSVIIGEGVTLGENVTIYQNVTIGGGRRGDWQAGRYPSIGSGTTVFSGAAIIGPIKIGRNCVIGANAVVNTDVPDNHTAAGVPAKIWPSQNR